MFLFVGRRSPAPCCGRLRPRARRGRRRRGGRRHRLVGHRSPLVAGGGGLVALVLFGVIGIGGPPGSRGPGPVSGAAADRRQGGGGFGGGGGGGFSSGGGGDFGGGGA